MKGLKLYKVTVGHATAKSGDCTNWMGSNVIARDALAAAKKKKLSRNEYIVAIEMLNTVEIE